MFFNVACVTFGLQLMTSTPYHPCTNVQTESYNKTIIDRLCQYFSEHQNGLDVYVLPLTYAYDPQLHKSTCTMPFSLTLCREPPRSVDIVPPAVADNAHDHSSQRLKQTVLTRINLLKTKATIALQRAQQRYKTNFDSRDRQQPKFHEDDYVHVDTPPRVRKWNSADDSFMKLQAKK